MIGDNDIYEGTGWHIRGSHTSKFNSNSTGIAFIGNFNGIPNLFLNASHVYI